MKTKSRDSSPVRKTDDPYVLVIGISEQSSAQVTAVKKISKLTKKDHDLLCRAGDDAVIAFWLAHANYEGWKPGIDLSSRARPYKLHIEETYAVHMCD